MAGSKLKLKTRHTVLFVIRWHPDTIHVFAIASETTAFRAGLFCVACAALLANIFIWKYQTSWNRKNTMMHKQFKKFCLARKTAVLLKIQPFDAGKNDPPGLPRKKYCFGVFCL